MRKFIFLIAFLVSASFMQACDCTMYPLECYIDTTELIFVGSVEIMDSSSITLLVQEVLKGEKIDKRVLFKNVSNSNCDFPFEKDVKFLLFAHDLKNGFIAVNSCSYSGKYDKTTYELTKSTLRDLKKSVPVCRKREEKNFLKKILKRIFSFFAAIF